MAKRAPSSSSAGTPAVKKAKVVTKQEVVTEKKPVATTCGKKANVKVEPKANVKVEPKANVKVEPKANAKVDPKANVKVEPKANVKVEPKANVKVEPKANVKVEPKANVKVEPKAEGSGGRKSTQPAAVASASKVSASKTKSVVIIKEEINVRGKVKVKEEPTDESIMSAASASTSKASTSKALTSKPKKPQLKAKPSEEEEEAANQVIKAETYDEELNEFTVERILDKDIFEDGITKYKVKWLGYSMKQCTWESVHNLANSMRHVLRWERDHPNWKLAPLARPIDNAKRARAIGFEYLHLTLGGYRIMEKYGQVNGLTWFLVAREKDVEQVDDKTDEEVKVVKVEKVLCLVDRDPYYNQIGTVKEYAHVLRKGAWDDRLDFDEDEEE